MDVVEGKRIGTQYYIENDYIYRRKWKKNSTYYLWCIQNPCPGRATYKEDVSSFKSTRDHTHAPDPTKVQVLKFRQDLNKAVAKTSSTIKKVYYEVAENHQNAAQEIGFISARSRMGRIRKTTLPPIPRNFCNLRDFLTSDDWKHLGLSKLNQQPFFRCFLQADDGGEMLVFISPIVSEHLSLTKRINIDGTFKITPTNLNATQLLTIHVTYLNKAYAAVYVLMSNRTHTAYCVLLEYLKSCFPDMMPDESMSDFEIAERSSLATVFPGIRTRGCWFHYAQAVWLKHKALGLFHLCGNNVDAKKILKMVMALPLLPADKISYGLQYIKLQIRLKNFDDFATFVSYIEGYWMTEVGVETLSVYKCPQRTNNHVESFHMQLLLQAGSQPHPAVWDFMKIIREVDRNESLRFLAHKRGKENSCAISKAYQLQEQKIRKAESFLQTDAYTVWDFMEATCHSVETLEDQLRGGQNCNRTNISLIQDEEIADEDDPPPTF